MAGTVRRTKLSAVVKVRVSRHSDLCVDIRPTSISNRKCQGSKSLGTRPLSIMAVRLVPSRATRSRCKVRKNVYRAFNSACPRCDWKVRRNSPQGFLSPHSLQVSHATSYTNIHDMSVTSMLTVLLQRVASQGLRKIPEMLQREAQKALENSQSTFPAPKRGVGEC